MGRGSALTCDGNTAEWSHQNPMIRLSRCLTANFLFGVNHFLSAQLLSSAGWCSISHSNPSDKAWRASRHGGSRVWLQPCFVHCFLQIEVTGLSGLSNLSLATWIGLIAYAVGFWHALVIRLRRWTSGVHWWSWPFQGLAMLLLSCLVSDRYHQPLMRSSFNMYCLDSVLQSCRSELWR